MSDRTRLRAFAALCTARLREYYREREVLFWGFAFPLILSAALAVAFRERPPEPSAVVVLAGAGAEEIAKALEGAPLVEVRVAGESEAALDLRMARADVVVVPPATTGAPVEFRLDPSRPEAGIARARVDDALQRSAGRKDPLSTRIVTTSDPGGRYVDFLVPGLVGLNLMSGGMWGVGFVLVDMRMKKLLRRLLATPMRPSDFLAAQMATRVAFTIVEVTVLLGFGRIALGVPVRGSLAAILAVSVLGGLTFAGLGLLVASRARRIEVVSGLMNVVMLPMFIGSGVFFSVERFPNAVQPFLRVLPLTALNDVLRAITLEGASLGSQLVPLALLMAWTLVTFGVGLRIFRWT
jgi:ABC-2 type transport system permease protein